MKISNLTECTTAGAVATVAQPFETVQKRTPEKKLKGSNLLKGIKTSAKYANSLHESEQVEEGLKFNGGIPDVDHMHGAIMRGGEGMSKVCPHCNGNRYSWTNYEQGKTPNHPWINPNTATLKSKEIPCPACDGGRKKVPEGKKVDRMVGHVKSSEKKLGKSSKEAENIAWATANKRGMLDNKNKKQGVAEGKKQYWDPKSQKVSSAPAGISYASAPDEEDGVYYPDYGNTKRFAKKSNAVSKTNTPEPQHNFQNTVTKLKPETKQRVLDSIGIAVDDPEELQYDPKYNFWSVVDDYTGEVSNIKITKQPNGKLSASLIDSRKGVAEGRFVKGPGGVPLDRQGNAIPPNPQAVPVAPAAVPVAPEVEPETDPELRSAEQAADVHYSSAAKRKKSIEKFLLRSVKHAKEADTEQNIEIRKIKRDMDAIRQMASNRPVTEAGKKSGPINMVGPDKNKHVDVSANPSVAQSNDPELRRKSEWAQRHYGATLSPDEAMNKWMQRGLDITEKNDKRHDAEIAKLMKEIAGLKRIINNLHPHATGASNVAEGEITEDDVVLSADRRRPKSGLLSKPEQAMNPADTVKLDVPLLIRLLEFAKEDAADDMALHDLAEKLVARGARGRTLTMKDYDSLVPSTPEAPAPAEGEQEDFEGKFNQEMDEGPEQHYAKDPSGYYRNLHTGRLHTSPGSADGNDSYMTPAYMLVHYKKRLSDIEASKYRRPREVAQLKAKIAKLSGEEVTEVSDTTVKSYLGKAMTDTITGKKDRNPGMKRAISRLAGTNKPLTK